MNIMQKAFYKAMLRFNENIDDPEYALWWVRYPSGACHIGSLVYDAFPPF